jgi:hypothetical protein
MVRYWTVIFGYNFVNICFMKVYISGKVSGLSTFDSGRNFHDAKNEITKRGDCAVNPLCIEPFLSQPIWICYMITDIIELLKCNKIYMLENWKESRGARVEHFIARLFNIKIEYKK